MSLPSLYVQEIEITDEISSNLSHRFNKELPASYQERECAEFGKLGLMGSTILFASGDDGVAGSFGDCAFPNNQTVDGDHEGAAGIRFVPSWPRKCPSFQNEKREGADNICWWNDSDLSVLDGCGCYTSQPRCICERS